MTWHQFSFSTTHLRQEAVEHDLLEHGAVSITLRDAQDQPLLEPKPFETPLWDDIIVDAMFDTSSDVANILHILETTLTTAECSTLTYNHIQDQDWVRTCLDDFKPMNFGTRLWIVPTHTDNDFTLPEHTTALQLDPGLAFGTGTHATTRLCLNWLDENIHGGETIMDFGCGSGILAIAGLLLGAHQAHILDIDEQAIYACQCNAKRNGMLSRIHCVDSLDTLNDTPDVWLANILAQPLIELAPRFAQHCKPDCAILLSGILESQVQAVIDCYEQWFKIIEIRIDDGWALISGQRNSLL